MHDQCTDHYSTRFQCNCPRGVNGWVGGWMGWQEEGLVVGWVGGRKGMWVDRWMRVDRWIGWWVKQ